MFHFPTHNFATSRLPKYTETHVSRCIVICRIHCYFRFVSNDKSSRPEGESEGGKTGDCINYMYTMVASRRYDVGADIKIIDEYT